MLLAVVGPTGDHEQTPIRRRKGSRHSAVRLLSSDGRNRARLIIVLLVALWLSVDEVIRELAEILHTVHLPEDLTPSIRTERLKTVIATLLERHGILEVSLLQDS